MRTTLSVLANLLVVLYFKSFVGFGNGLPLQDNGARHKRSLSLNDHFCPPGTSAEGCFINKLNFVMSLSPLSSKDTRTIGKRSLPIGDLDDVASDGLDLRDIAQMLGYIGETRNHISDGRNYDTIIVDDTYIPDRLDTPFSISSDSMPSGFNIPEQPQMSDEDIMDYLYQSGILDNNLVEGPYKYPINKRRPVNNNKTKRQFSCRGDTYTCFLRNVQYILDIQRAMSHA